MRGVSKDGRKCSPAISLAAILRGSPRRGGEHLGMTADVFSFINIKFFGFPWIVIPVLRTSFILIASCPTRALSRSDPSVDRARAGRTGAPRNGRRPGGRWSAGRRGAEPWARAVPCRARWVHHLPPRVPVGALAPPTAPSPRAVREGLANLGRFAPRECRSLAV